MTTAPQEGAIGSTATMADQVAPGGLDGGGATEASGGSETGRDARPPPSPPQMTGAGAEKYIRFMLSLDPHARRATFSSVKKEVRAEFDKLRGCKRCEFVQFVFDVFDLQGARPLPWILPRAQLMALLAPQRLVNLLQFVWKDDLRIVLSDSLVVEDRLLTSFLQESLMYLQEVHSEWEECDKHRGYPGPSELQSTARRLQEREDECTRELSFLASVGAAEETSPGAHVAPVSPANQDTAQSAGQPVTGDSDNPAAAAMEALRSRWGVSNDTLAALALLGDRMSVLPVEHHHHQGEELPTLSAVPLERSGSGSAAARPPPHIGRRAVSEEASGRAVGRWGTLLAASMEGAPRQRHSRPPPEESSRRAVGRWGSLLAATMEDESRSHSGVTEEVSQRAVSRWGSLLAATMNVQQHRAMRSPSPGGTSTASSSLSASPSDAGSQFLPAGSVDMPSGLGSASVIEPAQLGGDTPHGSLRSSSDGDGRSDPSLLLQALLPGSANGQLEQMAATRLPPPGQALSAEAEARSAKLREEIVQVGFRRARLSRACEHGVAIGSRRLLGLMLTICWRRLIATCQAAETRQVLAQLTGMRQPCGVDGTAVGFNLIGSPARLLPQHNNNNSGVSSTATLAPPPQRSRSLDSMGVEVTASNGSPSLDEASSCRSPQNGNGASFDSSQVQRCLDTITELQVQLREAKRELRASQLREAEAVEGGSVALMEAEEARVRLRRSENHIAELQAELDKRRAKPGALAGLGAEDLRSLAEELEAAASAARTAEAVATAEAAALCPVCWAARKDMAFQCGHQTCVGCGKRLELCPICRSDITLRIQLF